MSSIGNKYHQLQYALDILNATSHTTFVPGPNFSFDEGGVASRSRMNPVRQYNKDKPNKFCVDIFVVVNNEAGNIPFVIRMCTRVTMLQISAYLTRSRTCQLLRRLSSTQLSNPRLTRIPMASVDYSWTIDILMSLFSYYYESSLILSRRVPTGRIA